MGDAGETGADDRLTVVRGDDGSWQLAPPGSDTAAPPRTEPVHPPEGAVGLEPEPEDGALVRGPDGRWRVHRRDPRDDDTGRTTDGPAATGSAERALATTPDGTDTATDTPALEGGPIVRRLAVPVPDGPARQLVVTGDGGHPVAHLVDAVRARGVEAPLLPADEVGSVEALGLRDGQSVDDSPAAPPVPTTGLVLRVVGGPDAGASVGVGDDPVRIGRSEDLELPLRDVNASRHHASVLRGPGGVVVTDLGSTNGTLLEGTPVDRAIWEPGATVRVGDSLLQLVELDPSDEVVLEEQHGQLGLNRRFRAGLEPPPDKVRFPRPPNPGEIPAWNLLTALLPAVGIIGMAFLFGRPQFAFFAVMSPMISGGRTISARKAWREKKARMEAEHDARIERAKAQLEAARIAERAHRRTVVPDPARLVEAALRPTRELWSRRGTDDDALTVRVGAAPSPSDIAVDAPEDEEDRPTSPTQPFIPVGISLDEFRGLALVGSLDRLRPLACSLVLQTAVLHAPSEVQITFLGGADAEASWSWLQWLPHVRRGRLEASLMMGTDAGSRASRIEELRRLVTQRREQLGDRGVVFAKVLVVVDDASARLTEGIAEVLRDGGEVGVHAITLDTIQVPEGCDASVVVTDAVDAARVERLHQPPVTGVITDAVDPARCEQVARRLAGITVVGEDADEGLPTTCRLLSTIGVAADPRHVAARWAARSPSTSAVIGVGLEGPVSLDLTRDGPHALVAGTTRSGKSEFIKTFVASLAIENHPDHLSFLFIDFKGGGDYQTLKDLPHAVELSTSLDDPAAFDRSLQMLDAEVARRQRLVVAANAATIEGYMATPGGPPEPMPRLVVVVDEFAELKDRQPQQLDRLVSVARTGGAFGIHLLLATQRPSGVVTGQIDANVGLRVCFRVKDEAESKEILGSPHAGRIAERHRGRCYLRSAARPLTEVQTARVAGARPGATSAEPIAVHDMTWARLGRPVPRRDAVGEVPDPDTDLWDVRAATAGAAAMGGWTANAVPWPGPLPDQLALADLPPVADAGPDDVVLGLADEPSRQRQVPLVHTLGRGHVVVAGSGRTGRSTALRVLLAQLLVSRSPADVHVVGFDYGGGALLPLRGAPHCLALSMEDLSGTTVVIEELEEELARRRDLFADNGWPDLPTQRARSDDPLPWIVLVIDGWDNLAEDGARQALPQRVANLLARGGPQGLHAVLAGDRGTTQSMIARHLTHRYALRFNRSVDAEMQGIMAKELPLHQPPGRAIEVTSRRLVHFAELDDPDGVGQARAFTRIVDEVAARAAAEGLGRATSGKQPLPEVVPTSAVGPPPAGMGLPVLAGMGDAPREPVWVDCERTGGVMFVAGPAGSGRSTTLWGMAVEAMSRDVDVVVVAPEGSPLCGWAAERDVPVHGGDVRSAAVTPADGRQLLVVVDDLDALDDGPHLSEVLGQPKPGRAVVAAADGTWMKTRFTGLAAGVRRPKVGVLLHPVSTSVGLEFFSASLKESAVGSRVPGRGVFGYERDLTVVQTASPDPA